MTFDDKKGLQIALDQAKKSYSEGGIPIGSCIISSDGTVLGQGHNERIQKHSAILHGEMSALENAGRLPGKTYKDCTIYTTLSPCSMCTGAILLYGFKRVVMGENVNFLGNEKLLIENGVEVVNLNDQECIDLMAKFIKEKPQDWNEDIGE